MLNELLGSYTFRIVLMGTVLLGLVSGIIGVILTLRKQALIGDVLSHSTLPGVVLAYIITKESSLYVSIIGAIVASIVSVLIISLIKKYSRLKNDAILALILSAFFGFGQVLLSIIRDTAGQEQARLNKFIFGQAATMSKQDIIFLSVILFIVLAVIITFWRHIKLFIYNSEYYQSLGFSKTIINIILNAITILVVVSGIQAVGVILLSALIIAPAVTARLWSDKLLGNVIISAIIGGLSGFLGTLFSVDVPTGPVIVIFVTSIFLVSVLIAPKKGIIWTKITNLIHKKQIKQFQLLIHIYEENKINDISNPLINEYKKMGYLSNNNEITLKGEEKVLKILRGELR